MRIFWYAFIGLIISTIMVNILDNVYDIDAEVIVLSTIICGCTGAIVSIIEETMGKNNKLNQTKDE